MRGQHPPAGTARRRHPVRSAHPVRGLPGALLLLAALVLAAGCSEGVPGEDQGLPAATGSPDSDSTGSPPPADAPGTDEAAGGDESDGSGAQDGPRFELSLSWDAPLTNADGSSLHDLGGYRIYDGPSSRAYTHVTDVGRSTSVTLESLPAGIRYFAVTAYDTDGNESDFSEEFYVTLGDAELTGSD